jgi:hypothetical protein
MTDPETQLKRIIKETGETQAIYGGFEIKVLTPALFPWHELLNQLFEIGQKVWVERREGKIYIVSEPNIQ